MSAGRHLDAWFAHRVAILLNIKCRPALRARLVVNLNQHESAP
jgi:hypothetical protein